MIAPVLLRYERERKKKNKSRARHCAMLYRVYDPCTFIRKYATGAKKPSWPGFVLWPALWNSPTRQYQIPLKIKIRYGSILSVCSPIVYLYISLSSSADTAGAFASTAYDFMCTAPLGSCKFENASNQVKQRTWRLFRCLSLTISVTIIIPMATNSFVQLFRRGTVRSNFGGDIGRLHAPTAKNIGAACRSASIEMVD